MKRLFSSLFKRKDVDKEVKAYLDRYANISIEGTTSYINETIVGGMFREDINEYIDYLGFKYEDVNVQVELRTEHFPDEHEHVYLSVLHLKSNSIHIIEMGKIINKIYPMLDR